MTSKCSFGSKLAVEATKGSCFRDALNSHFSVLCKLFGHFEFADKQNQQIVTVLNLLKINRRAVKSNFPKPGCYLN